MNLISKVLFPGILLLLSQVATASRPDDARPHFNFSIQSIIDQRADSCFATIGSGKMDGLFTGSTGSWLADAGNGTFENRGTAWIKELHDHHAVVVVVNEEFRNAALTVESLGQIQMAVIVPQRTYRGLFFDLVSNGVKLKSLMGTSLLDKTEVLELESRELEEMILNDLVEELIFVAEELHLQMEDPVLEGGLFGGHKLLETMEETKRPTVRSFLHFINAKPALYGSENWKFGEIYATWLVQGTPHTAGDLGNILMASTDDGFLTANLNTYRPVLLPNIVDAWNLEARKLAETSAFEEAHALNGLAIKTAVFIDNPDQLGWGQYYKAEILEKQGETERKALAYEKAQVQFWISRNKAAETLVSTYLGAAYLELNKPKKAKKMLKKAVKQGQELFLQTESDFLKPILCCALVCLGESQAALGQQRKAIRNFKYALVHQDDKVSMEGRSQTLYIYSRLANSSKTLGRSDDVRKWNKKSKTMRTEVAVAPTNR